MRKRSKSRVRLPSQELKKKFKKSKNYRKRRRRYSSSEDSTNNRSDTSPSVSGANQDEKRAKTERFRVVAQEYINKYHLPKELVEYTNKYCNKFNSIHFYMFI